MTSRRRTGSHSRIAVLVALAIAGCGAPLESSPKETSPAPPPSDSTDDGTPATDLSAIGCATDDPDDVGELTGVWAGNEGGVYYIRHVGDCVWWVRDRAEGDRTRNDGPGRVCERRQRRMVGPRIDLEWADVPLGDILGGGGLTLAYGAAHDQLTVTGQRGDWEPFGASVFTRIDPDASPSVSPSP